MVEMERRGGAAGRWARQQAKVMSDGVSGKKKRKSDSGRDEEVIDGVGKKARDLSRNRVTQSADRRSSKRFVRLGCGVSKGGDAGAIAVKSFSGKQVGLVRGGGGKMDRKSDGYTERDFSGLKIANIGDYCIEDGCSVVKEVVDEEVSDAGGETSGARVSSSIAHRTRSQMDRLMCGVKKMRANMPRDLIQIDDSDNDGDAGDEEKVEADIINSSKDRENKGNKDDSVLSCSVEDDEVIMRHMSIPVAKRTRKQIKLRCNEVFGKRRKLGGNYHHNSKLSPEIIYVCGDVSEDDSRIVKETSEVEEKTSVFLGSLVPSCAATRTRLANSMHFVLISGDDHSENLNRLHEKSWEKEEKDEEDEIIGGLDKEDCVDRESSEDEANEDDSKEQRFVDGERGKDSKELWLECSSEEKNDVPKNKRYLVDEFGNLHSEDEAISTFFEKGGRDETETENNSHEDCVHILDDDDEDVDDGDDADSDGNEQWEEGEDNDDEEKSEEEDDICEDEYNDDNSVDDSVKEKWREDEDSADDLSKFPENKCYLVDEFGILYSEDEDVSTFVEKGERYKTEAGNNGREDWIHILDDDGEDEDVDENVTDGDDYDEDDDDDDDEEWVESDDVNCEDEYNDNNSVKASSDKENVFSMHPSVNITRHRMRGCVARRTRSQFKITSDIMKEGTFSNPYCLESEDDDDQKIAKCVDSRSGKSNKRRLNSASEGGVHHMPISEGKGEEHDMPLGRKLIRRVDDSGKILLANSAPENGDKFKQISKGQGATLLKRKHIQRACDARKVLLEAIWSKRDTLDESINIVIPKVERITNWKFTFEEEDSQPTEISEAESEFDKLWMEFEFCLRSSEMESGNMDMVENGIMLHPTLDPCLKGNHDAILDEEIGFRCRNCSIILQEIRDVVAPFRKDPVERYVKRDFGKVDDDDFFGKLTNASKTDDLKHGFPSDHDGTVWDLIPGIKSTLFPHQQEGFEFIWKNIAGAVNLSKARRLKESNDWSGCIISHAPGTGKSRLTLVFLQAYLKFFPDCRPVIIAPKSMLLTWEEEFKKWNVDVPFHNLNNDELSGKEDAEALSVLARSNNGSPRKEILRMVKLYSWKYQSGVLGISYSLFEKLTLGRNTEADDLSEGNVLLQLPGILVLDEGHTPRNNGSLIWQALSNVRTEKRICLSGTPFQNNFQELFNTFCMARPGFASTLSHGNKGNGFGRRGRKSTVKANWANLTNSICENNVEELEKLKAMMSPFVHVYNGNVLQDTLPGLSQRVVYLRPGFVQKSLLQTADAIGNVIERRHIASLISVHPSLLLQQSSAVITRLFPDIREELEGTKLTLRDGAKTKFLIEFLRLTDALKEKVLVFSDYIDPLMFLKDQLKSSFGWAEGEEILYMDGRLETRHRQASISIFNEEDSKAKVLLASTRACCEGISLVGASRVVLLDAAWNPSVQRQAISRAYRIGQKRFVYVYYLITYATVEEDVYRQQVNKDRLSNMVFPSAKDRDMNGSPDSTNCPEDQILQEMLQHSTISDSIEKIV